MGGITSEKKNNPIATIPEMKYQLGKPSLFNTKIKEIKIIALPASGCNKIRKMGNPIMANPINWCFVNLRLI